MQLVLGAIVIVLALGSAIAGIAVFGGESNEPYYGAYRYYRSVTYWKCVVYGRLRERNYESYNILLQRLCRQ